VFAFTDMVHLLAHEFASLRAGCFAFVSVFASPFQGLFFRHVFPPLPKA
jgi:hypothetical protein